jgi:hypothetical protein
VHIGDGSVLDAKQLARDTVEALMRPVLNACGGGLVDIRRQLICNDRAADVHARHPRQPGLRLDKTVVRRPQLAQHVLWYHAAQDDVAVVQ